MRKFCGSFVLMVSWALLASGAFSQQPEKKAVLETPSGRLMNAKNVVVMRARGSDIPYDVIKSTLDGWGRFNLVETKDKADLVVEIATTGGESSMRVASSSGPSPLTGRIEQSSSSSNLSDAAITMTVYDARNKRVLWVGNEMAKSPMKQTARENNLVEAAERLASKFHDRLEQPPPKEKD
jgi:hypothetical protein